MVCKMGDTRAAYLVVLLVSISFGGQSVVAQQYEYEYYYEEANATSTTTKPDSTASESTTVTLMQDVESTTETSTPALMALDKTETSTEFTPLTGSIDDILERNDWSTAAVENDKPVTTTDVRRTDHVATQMNSTRPTKFNVSNYKTTSKPKAHTQPGIVLNIYTGMYGMNSWGKQRPSGNLGGRNNYWPRAQPSLQGWYGMYGMQNRRPMQSYAPRQPPPPRPPVYRGRGPQNGYEDEYNSFAYETGTKPRGNKQQGTRGTALDQQASMAVFNFLLQALGQRAGSSVRSQPQAQQGSRRRQ